jgi:phosphoenolpyruvate synthase/pyruvate phosphate dikinase
MDLQLLQKDTVFFDKKRKIIDDILNLLDTKNTKPTEIGDKARALILSAAIPDEIRAEISTAYESLSKQSDTNNLGVAVRSSATAEDLPSASFAGQMESFLILLVLINYLMLYIVVTFLIHESCYKVPMIWVLQN